MFFMATVATTEEAGKVKTKVEFDGEPLELVASVAFIIRSNYETIGEQYGQDEAEAFRTAMIEAMGPDGEIWKRDCDGGNEESRDC